MRITNSDIRHIHNFEFDRTERRRVSNRTSAKVYISLSNFPQEVHTEPKSKVRRDLTALMSKHLHDELNKASLLIDPTKKLRLTFSRTCGCGCGCSPGFIARGTTTGVDAYLNIDFNDAEA